jgi:flavin-binding protein dodecin
MPIIKIKEIIGISEKSFEDAIKEAVKIISAERKNVSGVKVVGLNLDIKDGKIVAYKANLKYAYLWEKKLQKR